MSAPRRLAVSYTRFSAMAQAKGDSETRQEQMFRDFCTRHNLTPLAEVFADRGKSGYKDEHRKKGRLGQLIAQAKDDRFDPGTVFVVEAWDRLGRLRPDKQTELIAELLKTGVHIGVCRLDDIFTEDDLGTHKWTTLAVFIQLAYQESKQKADRVAASWERRRERARASGDMLGCRLPAWLERVGEDVRQIPDRAATVKQIFKLAANGYGQRRIVQALEKEKVPPFGAAEVRADRQRSQFCGHWTVPFIRLILNDRRALGEFQPFKDGKPDGSPLVGYLPAVISEKEFLLARAAQAQRDSGRTASPRKHINVFRGLLTHARDGEGWQLHNKGTVDKPELLLLNHKGNAGRSQCYTFPYHIFEREVLAQLREVNPRDVLPKEKQQASNADVIRAKLLNVRQDIASLQADLKEKYSKALANVLRDREIEEERIAVELQDELAKIVKPASRAWKEFPSLVDMIAKAADPDDVRLKLRSVLRRMIDSAWLLIVPWKSYRYVVLQIYFAGGQRRDYLIVHQSAANRRPGGTWCRSVADILDGHDLDLRDQEQAVKFAAILEACVAKQNGGADISPQEEHNRRSRRRPK